jgi:peptidoglycan/LPS O-acetylase OafA/YrhL
MRSERIPSLDGLRALSIAIVVASHRAAIYDPKDPRFNAGWAILSNGQIGVSIFFVISGFLITSLLLGEWDRNGQFPSANSTCAGRSGSCRPTTHF